MLRRTLRASPSVPGSSARDRHRLELEAVPRLVRPSVRELGAFARAGKPLVLHGAIDDWPAIGRWSPEALRDRAGDLAVKTYVIPEGQVLIDPRTGFRLEPMTIATYVDHVTSGDPPRYYLRTSLETFPGDMQNELGVPIYCRRAPLLRRNIWFSAPDTISHLHFDLPHNLIAQLHGNKRFVLFPWRERKNLYPFSPLSSVPHLSRIDPENPDLDRFPRLARARGWFCELEPGDMLFMPSRMWHHARSLGSSVTANFWWPPVQMLPLVALSDLYKRARGLNI